MHYYHCIVSQEEGSWNEYLLGAGRIFLQKGHESPWFNVGPVGRHQ